MELEKRNRNDISHAQQGRQQEQVSARGFKTPHQLFAHEERLNIELNTHSSCYRHRTTRSAIELQLQGEHTTAFQSSGRPSFLLLIHSACKVLLAGLVQPGFRWTRGPWEPRAERNADRVRQAGEAA